MLLFPWLCSVGYNMITDGEEKGVIVAGKVSKIGSFGASVIGIVCQLIEI
jgi:hypothetical protein